MKEFQKTLSRLMSKKGFSQAELAERSGIKQPTISRYLQHSAKAEAPSLRDLIRLGDALGCSLNELAGIDPPGEKGKNVPGHFELFKQLNYENKELVEKIAADMKNRIHGYTN